MTPTGNLLAASRLAELRQQADELAAVARPPAPIRTSPANRRLLLLIARERRRIARLLAELVK